MFKIIKIRGLTVYDKKRYKDELFAEELADLAYRNGAPSNWLSKTVLKELSRTAWSISSYLSNKSSASRAIQRAEI